MRGLLRRLAPTSFRGRIMLSTVVLVALVMLVTGVALQVILGFTARRDIASRLDERTNAVVASIDDASTRSMTVTPSSLPSGVHVYDGSGNLLGGALDEDLRDPADDLAGATSVRTVRVEDFQLRATPFITPSGQRGVAVVSVDASPYERSEFYALLVTIVLGLAVVGIAAAMARRITAVALRPVRQMAESAADWSEHDLTQRFTLGAADDEIATLGETLDHLLDRVAHAIRSEQRLTAELAHELRTPLSAIQGSADLALLRGLEDARVREDLEEIGASARAMATVITTLLDLARDAGTREVSECTTQAVADRVRDLVPDRLTFVDDVADPSVRVAAPLDLVVRALGPIVDNAARYAASTVTLSTRSTADGVVVVSVSDDGPGVAEETYRTLFEPGTSTSGGTGLGLGISRRVARTLGGAVSVTPRAGGATFELRLPHA